MLEDRAYNRVTRGEEENLKVKIFPLTLLDGYSFQCCRGWFERRVGREYHGEKEGGLRNARGERRSMHGM
jgi:hypothetical protein